MSWRTWLAEKIMPKVKQAEGDAVAAVSARTGLSARAVLCLLALTSLLTFAVAYGIYWRFMRQEKPPAGLAPVQTQGGEKAPGYAAKEIKGLGKVPSRTTTRPVQTTPVPELPAKEQGYAPVVAPAVGSDNVARSAPELLTTSVVPPHRGETEVRTWLNPDGSAQNVLTPRNEPFWGWKWKHLELEGGYGIGGKQVDVQATWLPLRLGNVHVGARAETWMEPMGGMKAAGSIRVRWEPFR